MSSSVIVLASGFLACLTCLGLLFLTTGTGVARSSAISSCITGSGITSGSGSASGSASGSDSGSSSGIRYDNDPNSYLVLAIDTYYWANITGNLEIGPFPATSTNGPPITSAIKTVGDEPITYNVRGTRTADFITAGYSYVKPTIEGPYLWCNISGVEEDPAVVAGRFDLPVGTAERYGIKWNYDIA